MTTISRRIPILLCTLAAFGCMDPKPTTGDLVISVNGLPAAAVAAISVTGPNDFVKSVTATTTLENLAPGEYTVRVSNVLESNVLYASSVSQETKSITAGATETSNVAYSLASGTLDLSVSGLPAGISPTMQLTGISGSALGYARSILRHGIIGPLPPGDYTIRSDTIRSPDGDRFGTSTFLQTVTISPSLTPVSANVAFALVSGTLAVSVSGLPVTTQAMPVTIKGPGGFSRTTASSVTYRGILPGTYVVTAPNVNATCPNIWSASNAPTPLQVQRSVDIGQAENVTVSYQERTAPPEWFNLRIDGAYLVQVTQSYTGSVPLIADRPALLRVFGVGNQCNSATPKVRLTLSDGTVADLSFAGTTSSVGTTADEGVLTSSWNYVVSANKVRQGLRYSVHIDPDNAFAEVDETDNRFPATGQREVDVRVIAPTGVRFVPVTVMVNGEPQTGNVHDGNKDQFLELSRKLHPIHSYDVDVRAPYTTSRAAFQADDQNKSWGGVLSEIRALRVTDSLATQTARYYYGVAKVTYFQGVAGIGYIGARAALGWDHLPSASVVMAHELGHNYARLHTPCGNPGGIDTSYPSSGFYAGGYAGTFGYDFATNQVKHPQFVTDVMGYCRDQWISDFSYVGMLNWLQAYPSLPMTGSAGMQPSLLIWGRIVDGEPVLEPAFEINARPERPVAGSYRVLALDENGAEILAVSFGAERIADVPGDQETFAFTIPKSALGGRILGSLRLVARGKTVTSAPAGAVVADSRAAITRTGPRAVRMRWDASRFPVVMVRDPVRGHVLSFARGGEATIATDRDDLELVYSNNVRSRRETVRLK